MVRYGYPHFQKLWVSNILLHFPQRTFALFPPTVKILILVSYTAEIPENGGHDLLLTDDFLKGCAEMFSAPSRGYETSSRLFPPKHLNIVDPLKENNNLGRSVSKGNTFQLDDLDHFLLKIEYKCRFPTFL